MTTPTTTSEAEKKKAIFTLETQLVIPVRAHIESCGLDVHESVVFSDSVKTIECDMVAVEAGGDLYGIETKLGLTDDFLAQLLHRRRFFDFTIAAIPQPTPRMVGETSWRKRYHVLKNRGIGLRYVNPETMEVKRILEPRRNKSAETWFVETALSGGQRTHNRGLGGAPGSKGKRWHKSDDRFNPMREYVKISYQHGEHRPDTKEIVRMVGAAMLGYDCDKDAYRDLNKRGDAGTIKRLSMTRVRGLGVWAPQEGASA